MRAGFKCHARGKYLALTGEGESLCLKNKMLMDKCDGAIQNALTDEEQKDLEKLLNLFRLSSSRIIKVIK